MAAKISAREEKAANKEAEAVLASLSRAGEAAVAQTLDDIRESLKKDAPLMYHINALLHNPEWTGVLKASINGIAAVAASGDKPGKGWRLRAGIRKFGHLDRRVMQLLCYSTHLRQRDVATYAQCVQKEYGDKPGEAQQQPWAQRSNRLRRQQ